jgi:hypothetical protein
MEYINLIPILVDKFNSAMDRFIPGICVVVLFGRVLQYTLKRIQKDGFGKAIYLGTLAGIEAIALVFIIGFAPLFASRFIQNYFNVSTVFIRWVSLYVLVFLFAFLQIPQHSRVRGLSSLFILLTTFVLGWLYARWVGLIFVSIPIVLIFLHVMDKVAQAIIPASNPEDKRERWQRTQAFLLYMLGVQYPSKVASKKAGRVFEERIAGDPTNDLGKPGIVWTWPHQVVALSKGIQFQKVDGPGTVYTDIFESPVALIDLRTQLRTTVVHAITSDGMQIPAVVFMAFAIDKEALPRSGAQLAKPDIDHAQGSYPYSSDRVRAAIDTVSMITNSPNEESSESHWDEWVMKQIEQVAIEVLAERRLDELWHPRIDGLGVSALNEMAVMLKERVAPRLAEMGVQLFVARIVNYELDEEHPITIQNIKTWSTYWEQKITETRAESEAMYREEIEGAYAYAKSVLLDAIAESINAARSINAALPRHVIAQYYVHALEEYIKLQPGVDVADSRKRVEDLKGFLLYNRTEAGE